MDSEHNMRVNAHDDQLAIHSSVVFGRRARIVYDALVDQFFYRVTLYAMHSRHRIFLTRHIWELR